MRSDSIFLDIIVFMAGAIIGALLVGSITEKYVNNFWTNALVDNVEWVENQKKMELLRREIQKLDGQK